MSPVLGKWSSVCPERLSDATDENVLSWETMFADGQWWLLMDTEDSDGQGRSVMDWRHRRSKQQDVLGQKVSATQSHAPDTTLSEPLKIWSSEVLKPGSEPLNHWEGHEMKPQNLIISAECHESFVPDQHGLKPTKMPKIERMFDHCENVYGHTLLSFRTSSLAISVEIKPPVGGLSLMPTFIDQYESATWP